MRPPLPYRRIWGYLDTTHRNRAPQSYALEMKKLSGQSWVQPSKVQTRIDRIERLLNNVRYEPDTRELFFSRALFNFNPKGKELKHLLQSKYPEPFAFGVQSGKSFRFLPIKLLKELITKRIAPPRVATWEQAKQDGEIFQQIVMKDLTPYRLAKCYLNGDIKLVATENRFANRPLREWNERFKERYKRFLNALEYVYWDDLSNGQTGNMQGENLSTSIEGKVRVHFKKLHEMNPEEYKHKYGQIPPRNAFEEFINALWRIRADEYWQESYPSNP